MSVTVNVTVAVPADVLFSTELYRSGDGVSVRCKRCKTRLRRNGYLGLDDVLAVALGHDCPGRPGA